MCFADVPKSYVGMSMCYVEKMMRLANVRATDADGFLTDVPAAISWCVFRLSAYNMVQVRHGEGAVLRKIRRPALRGCSVGRRIPYVRPVGSGRGRRPSRV